MVTVLLSKLLCCIVLLQSVCAVLWLELPPFGFFHTRPPGEVKLREAQPKINHTNL